MTSGYHGSKTAVCIVERRKKSMAYRSVSGEKSYTGKTRVNFFVFLPYLRDHGLLRSINFATMTTWRNNFSFLFLLRCHSVILLHYIFQREKQERQQQQRTVKSKLREKRQISARARRYYDEYEVRMRARMLKRRTREEQVRKIKIFAFHLMK